MKYIIPKSINTENIEIKKAKLRNKKDIVHKMYYHYNSIELLGIPFFIKQGDYSQYTDKIVIHNESIINSIKSLNHYIISIFPNSLPLIDENNAIHHSHLLDRKKGDLYIIFTSINNITYKNCKKAKIYFIYD